MTLEYPDGLSIFLMWFFFVVTLQKHHTCSGFFLLNSWKQMISSERDKVLQSISCHPQGLGIPCCSCWYFLGMFVQRPHLARVASVLEFLLIYVVVFTDSFKATTLWFSEHTFESCCILCEEQESKIVQAGRSTPHLQWWEHLTLICRGNYLKGSHTFLVQWISIWNGSRIFFFSFVQQVHNVRTQKPAWN